jgi:hypothetical protein
MARIPLARKKKVVTLLVIYMDLLNQLFFYDLFDNNYYIEISFYKEEEWWEFLS